MPYSYEDYDVKSQTYADLRIPAGWKKHLSFFKENPCKALEQQKLLDAACGTGNYMLKFVDFMESIVCLDYSEGMLNKAKQNWKNVLNNKQNGDAKVSFVKGNICDLKNHKDSSFDAICNNQVLQHLRPDDDFADMKSALSEFYRVLKPEGRLVINIVATSQFDSHWWKELIPEATAKFMNRIPTIDQVRDALYSTGFRTVSSEPIIEEILYNPDIYFQPQKYLDINNFKNISSEFTLSSSEELKDGVKKIKKLISDNNLDMWFQQKEALRKERGQTTNIYAIKS